MLILSLTASCNKDDGGKVAFEHATMKPWFDSKCASCHASGGSNKANWFYDPTDYDNSIKAHITRLNQVIYTFKSMPPGGASQAELDQFKSWFDTGYPAK